MNTSIRTVTLHAITLRNFKGLRDERIELNGMDAQIFGRNGSGKTSVVDGFKWALTGKDSNGDTVFELQTKDEEGNVIHHLEHSLVLEMKVDGEPITVERTLQENWVTKRGSRDAKLGNNTTTYIIDKADRKLKDFTPEIENRIAPLSLIMLLSDVHHFSNSLSWQERRKILFELVGDIDTETIVADNPSVGRYLSILDSMSHEDKENLLSKERKEKMNDLKEIPARIDEVRRNIVDVDEEEEQEAQASIEASIAKIDIYSGKITSIKNGGRAGEIRKELAETQAEYQESKNAYNLDDERALKPLQDIVNKARESFRTDLALMDNELMELRIQTTQTLNSFASAKSEKAMIENRIKETQKMIDSIRSREPEEDRGADTCPVCERPMLDNHDHESYLKEFNTKKAQDIKTFEKHLALYQEELAEVSVTYNEHLTKGQEGETKIKDMEAQKEAFIQEQKHVIQQLENDVSEASANRPVFDATKQAEELHARIQRLKESLDSELNDRVNQIEKLEQLISQEKNDMTPHAELLASIEANKKHEKRIEHLRASQSEIGDALELIENDLFVLSEFIKVRADYVSDRVNDMFKNVRFELFETQKNGGIKEVCTVQGANGVDFNKGLNNAQKVQIGLEIIEVLSKHYGVRLPVFIDNRESVTHLPETDSQLISLFVSPKDRKLRVANAEAIEWEAVA